MTGFQNSAAYFDGQFVPLAEARVPVTHFAFRRSDVTYDVVSVWEGQFFRLDDHLRRFRASMIKMRMTPPETDDDLRRILNRLVALAGLRSAYVAMDCLRAVSPPGALRHSALARSYLSCFAVPWIDLCSPEQRQRGLHMQIATARRIPGESVDPRVKNFHWADLTAGQFEALDAGADAAVLLDMAGNVAEGPGFNLFCITDGVVSTPRRGVLEGVTRLSIMELCAELGLPLQVRDIPAEEFRQADEIFACTTAGGILPASRIDGRIMGNDRPGPWTNRLTDLYWQKRTAGWHGTPVDYSVA